MAQEMTQETPPLAMATPDACARGCGYRAHTSQRHGFCCNACATLAGRHGPACERRLAGAAAAGAAGADLAEECLDLVEICGPDGSALPWAVQVTSCGPRTVRLRTPGGNVACGEAGHFHPKGQHGKWATWELAESDQGASFRNVGHGKFLQCAQSTPALGDEPCFFATGALRLREAPPPVDPAVLTAADLAAFKRDGFLVLKAGIGQDLVRDALRSINTALGLGGDPKEIKLLPQVGRDVVNRSPRLWSALNLLLGIGNVAPWEKAQQVALRFPQPLGRGYDVPDVMPGTRYHIDGMGQNKLCPFSILCGVALSDQTRADKGNLHVFPGSHLNKELHRYYQEKIDEADQNEQDQRKPDLGPSTQVLLEPGDCVLAHQLLAHRVGQNFSEHIRYQLYYRVQHIDHDQLKHKVFDDIWTEFEC